MFHFLVKAAKHRDIAAVCRLSQKILNPTIPLKELEKLYVGIIEDIEQIVMVAARSGHMAGFIHARRVSDLTSGTYTEINEIAILPYYQGRGCADLLISAIEQWSSQMVTPKIKCIIKSYDEAVKALLQNRGYVDNGFGAFEITIV